MASQIIHCPDALLTSILSAIERSAWDLLGKIRLSLLGDHSGFRSIVVKAQDRRLAALPMDHGPDAIFVLWLINQPQPDPSYQPIPLPDDIVVEMIDLFWSEISAIDGITGHDLLSLAEVLNEVKEAPNRCPLAQTPREPENDYETRLVATAEDLRSGLAPALTLFDQELVRFRDRALRSGLGATIRRLSTQGPVADALHPEPSKHSDRFTLDLDLAHSMPLFTLQQRAEADRDALDLVRAGSATYGFGTQHCTHPAQLMALYRGIEKRWRQDDCFWRDREPEMEGGWPPAVSVEDVWPSMHRFSPAFDRRLLSHCHPIIRMSLGMREFARIQPLMRVNAHVAELLATALFEELTATPLPLLLALRHRSAALARALCAALELQRPEILANMSLRVAQDALAMGNRMLDQLEPEYRRWTAALLSEPMDPMDADVAVSTLLSSALVPLPAASDDLDLDTAAVQIGARILRRLGHLDLIETDGGRFWSAGIVRGLLLPCAG